SASFAKSGTSPSGVAAPWARAPSRASRRIGKASLIGVAGLLMSAWLGGAVFLASLHEDPPGASPLTLARSASYYGDRQGGRPRVVLSGGAGLHALAVAAAAAFVPRRRSLHGDARFARRGEVAAAGLFGSHGIILGRLGRRLIRLSGQQGVALAAPPRAGKGTG